MMHYECFCGDMIHYWCLCGDVIHYGCLSGDDSPGTNFTAESTEAMRIKCLAQGHNILLPGFEPSTSVSKTDILANRPICSLWVCVVV